MESFFASLKKEHVHHVRFHTRAEARAAVFEYVEIFYNRQRLHAALGCRTPVEARASMEGLARAQPRDVPIPLLHPLGGNPRELEDLAAVRLQPECPPDAVDGRWCIVHRIHPANAVFRR